jgi:hypothetical protein
MGTPVCQRQRTTLSKIEIGLKPISHFAIASAVAAGRGDQLVETCRAQQIARTGGTREKKFKTSTDTIGQRLPLANLFYSSLGITVFIKMTE